MEYDPKHYYPGGWKTDPETGGRRKQIYSWESVDPGDIGEHELVAVKAEENGFFVIDLDTLTDEAADFIDRTGLAGCSTRKVRSQGGGFHWYFEAPDGAEIPRLIGAVPGIDILGTGMVFCPPSPGYEVREGGEYISPAPHALLDAIGALAVRQRSPDRQGVRDRLEGLEPGSRNSRLFGQGLALRKKHNLDQRDIESILRRENAERGNPPLSEAEVSQIASSVASYQGGEEAKPPPELCPAVTLGALLEFKLPALEPICGPLMTASTHIIAAERGTGKSMLMLHMANAIASGGYFGKWQAQKKRVLYIDMDMATQEVQNRVRGGAWSKDLKYLTRWMAAEEGMAAPNIGDKVWQEVLTGWMAGFDVLVLDTRRHTLLPGTGPARDYWHPAYWQQSASFRHQMQNAGKSIVLLDHLSSDGKVKDTKVMEDDVEVVLTLKKSDQNEGLCLVMEETKGRALNSAVPQHGLCLTFDNGWKMEKAMGKEYRAWKMLEDGMSQPEVAAFFGVTDRTIRTWVEPFKT